MSENALMITPTGHRLPVNYSTPHSVGYEFAVDQQDVKALLCGREIEFCSRVSGLNAFKVRPFVVASADDTRSGVQGSHQISRPCRDSLRGDHVGDARLVRRCGEQPHPAPIASTISFNGVERLER